jgi:hypothetical protein
MPQIGEIKIVGRIDTTNEIGDLDPTYTDDLDDPNCDWFEVWQFQRAQPDDIDQSPGWVEIDEGSDNLAEVEQRAMDLKTKLAEPWSRVANRDSRTDDQIMNNF